MTIRLHLELTRDGNYDQGLEQQVVFHPYTDYGTESEYPLCFQAGSEKGKMKRQKNLEHDEGFTYYHRDSSAPLVNPIHFKNTMK